MLLLHVHERPAQQCRIQGLTERSLPPLGLVFFKLLFFVYIVTMLLQARRIACQRVIIIHEYIFNLSIIEKSTFAVQRNGQTTITSLYIGYKY